MISDSWSKPAAEGALHNVNRANTKIREQRRRGVVGGVVVIAVILKEREKGVIILTETIKR